MNLHEIINSDTFLLITGLASLVSLLIGFWAIGNIYNIKKTINQTSGRDSKQDNIVQTAEGKKINQAGGNISVRQ